MGAWESHVPASRPLGGQGEGIGAPEQVSGPLGVETPFVVVKRPQSTKEPVRGTASGRLKTTAPSALPCPHLTSLEKGPEGTGHLLVTENLETAVSRGWSRADTRTRG